MTETLTLADLDMGATWREVDVPEQLLADYRACTGWTGATAPLGLLPVIARRAYTNGKVMPPGGVLVEVDLHVHAELRPGPHQAQVRMQRLGKRNCRTRVRVHTALERDALPIADVNFLLDWPTA